MVELKCRNCGGGLATAKDHILTSGGTAVIRHGTALRCNHCGAEYLPGEELALPAHQQIDTVESGGTVIGAQISLSDSEQT